MDDFDTGFGSWDPVGDYTYWENLGNIHPQVTAEDISGMANLGYTPTQIHGISKTWDDLIRRGVAGLFLDKNENVDWRKVAAAAGGLYGLYQSNRPQEKVGYQGKIPSYTAVREAVPGSQYDPTRRPGSGGQRYFSDVKYVVPTDAEALTAARAAAKEEAAGLEALNRGNPAREGRAATEEAAAKGEESQQVREGTDASDVIKTVPVPKYAYGGIANLNKGRYLNGSSDGMADKIPANIDGAQEARLSHGEFVIPADVVSHLGNGNSEAGAQRLYTMMDRIRKARTGTAKQGKQIIPNKFLPA